MKCLRKLSSIAVSFTAASLLSSIPLLQADEGDLSLPMDSLTPELLSEQRGRADVEFSYQVNDSEQNALLQDNIISDSVTGDNTISGGAFSGMSGISTVIQNTGNQVIIQDTTMVNVMFNQ